MHPLYRNLVNWENSLRTRITECWCWDASHLCNGLSMSSLLTSIQFAAFFKTPGQQTKIMRWTGRHLLTTHIKAHILAERSGVVDLTLICLPPHPASVGRSVPAGWIPPEDTINMDNIKASQIKQVKCRSDNGGNPEQAESRGSFSAQWQSQPRADGSVGD